MSHSQHKIPQSFYSRDELNQIGLKSFGENVLISRKASIYAPQNIELGNHVRIDDFSLLSGGQGITFGNYVHISAYAAIYGGGTVTMEDYTGLSPRATILSESDDFKGDSMIGPFFSKTLKPKYHSSPVFLRRFSQVGAHSIIMPGVELKQGAVVGGNSFVNNTCEAWGIYAGSPAKWIRERQQTVMQLQKSSME